MNAVASENPHYRAELILTPTRTHPRELRIQLLRTSDYLHIDLFAKNCECLAFSSERLSDPLCYLGLYRWGHFLSAGGCYRVSDAEAQKIRALLGPLGLKVQEDRKS